MGGGTPTAIPCNDLERILAAAREAFPGAAEWTVDLDGHKMICQCGEEFSVGKHNLKNDICTVCNTEVYTFEDGTVMVSVYDTYGYCVLCLYYDDKGVLETKEETVYTYDEDGMPLFEQCYIDSKLSYESTYAIGKDGFPYVEKSVFYWDNGLTAEYTYDEYWNELSYKLYDEDGKTLLVDTTYEYTLTEDGLYTHQWVYESGVLTEETKFVIVEDEWGPMSSPVESLFYNEDGTKTVETYDEDGNVISRTEYDQGGNVIG